MSIFCVLKIEKKRNKKAAGEIATYFLLVKRHLIENNWSIMKEDLI